MSTNLVNVKTVIAVIIMLFVSVNCAEAQSKAAVAADPRASVKTVEEGYTKTPAQIRAAYEALNPEVYFKPYYHPNLRNYYLLDDSQAEMEFWEKSCKTVDNHWRRVRNRVALKSDGTINLGILESPIPKEEYYHFVETTIPAGQHKVWECDAGCSGLMPLGASAMRAGFALFAADPEGLKPFMKYCEAYNIFNGFLYSFINQGNTYGAWDGKTVKTKDGKVEYLSVSFFHFFNKWGGERTRLLELVKSKTPVKVIQEAATYYRDQILKHETAKNYSETRYYFHVFERVMNLWREFKGGGGEFNSFYSEYKKLADRYEEWIKLEYFYAPPIDIKSMNVDANLMEKAKSAAKLYASNEDETFNVDAVVFFWKDWIVVKAKQWPHHPDRRFHRIGLLTKAKDGRWMLRYAALVQKGDNRGGYMNEYYVNKIDPLYANNAERFPHAVNYKR